MDTPSQLASSLVCLALASSAADRPADLAAALQRFLEIESRFASYAKAPVPDAFRRSFDALLVASVDAERLAAIASLAQVGRATTPVAATQVPATQRHSDTATQPSVAATQRQSDTATEPSVAATQPEKEPVVVVESVVVETVPEPAAPVVVEPEPAPVAVVEEPVESEADRVLVAAQRLITRNRPGDAAKIVYRQLTKTPARRDLRLTLLEAATLNKDWRTAAAQTDLLQPFAEGEEVSMFYAAVALFESGRKSDARRLLERSRELVPKTEYVRYYTKRIESMQ